MGALLVDSRPFLYPPHTVAVCAAAARQAGLRVGVLDAVAEKLSAVETLHEMRKRPADAVAVLTSQGTALADSHFLRLLRHDRVQSSQQCAALLVFGPSAFFSAESFLAEGLADAVLLGEPEAALVEAALALAAGRRGLLAAGELVPERYTADNLIRDLDSLPFPAWHVCRWQAYGVASLLSSRGCPAGCAYCAYVLSQGRCFRAQSPDRTVEEMACTAAATDGAMMHVRDPIFAQDPARVAAICEGIKARRLKIRFACESRPEHFSDDLLRLLAAAGCSEVKIGLESGDPDLLGRLDRVEPEKADRYVTQAARVARTCAALGLSCQVFVMAGLPGQDAASLRRTREVLRRLPAPTIIKAKSYRAHPGVGLAVPAAQVPAEILSWLETANQPRFAAWRRRAGVLWQRLRPAPSTAGLAAPPPPEQHLLPRVYSLAGQQVFLTGGNGFLGGYVARALVAAGASVVALVRPGSELGPLADQQISVVRGDLRDPAAWEHEVRGCSSCFHLAALYAPASQAAALDDVNVSGTDRLLAVCARHGVRRVVHTSTIGTVGRPSDPRMLPDESTSFDNSAHVSDYAKSKFMGELVARSWQHHLEIVVVKPAAPVGAGDAKPSATGRRILAALQGEITTYPPGGINHAPARDIADGILAAAERGQPGETYILGHREGNLDHAAFLALVAEAAGMPPLRPQEAARTGATPAALTANPVRAIVELGMPQSDLRVAFAEAVAWYCSARPELAHLKRAQEAGRQR